SLTIFLLTSLAVFVTGAWPGRFATTANRAAPTSVNRPTIRDENISNPQISPRITRLTRMSVLSRSSLIRVHPCDPWFTLLRRGQVEAAEQKRAVMPVREDHLHAVRQLPAVHGAIVREIHFARVFVF